MALRCFIVDDNPLFLEASRNLLELEGINVVGVASTSKEALGDVAEHRPEVVLVDIELGEESGFDLTRRIAGMERVTPTTILVSSHLESDFEDLIEASPAVGFLPKGELSAKAIRDLLRSAAASRGNGEIQP